MAATNQEVASSSLAGRTNFLLRKKIADSLEDTMVRKDLLLPMTRLDTLFQQFLQERTYLKNVTPKTRVWYESAWKAFKSTRADAQERPASAALIERADLNRFVVRLRERGVKPVSCNTWLRAMNAFCRWLHEQGELPALVKLRPQRLEKRLLRTYDHPALRAILTFRPRDFSHWRVHVLVCTILDTGCRNRDQAIDSLRSFVQQGTRGPQYHFIAPLLSVALGRPFTEAQLRMARNRSIRKKQRS